jgi:30S ribosomal protein S31
MGRGDKRSAKGKRFKGSFGNSRKHKEESTVKADIAAAAKKKAEKVKVEAPKAAEKPTVKKAPARKAPAKKKTEE